MRRILCTTALLLAACGSKTTSNEANAAANQPAVNEASETAAPASAANEGEEFATNGGEADNGLGTLPPADAALRFVGKWAESQANCDSQPWTFTAKELAATDGPHCSFYKVTKVPGGYDLAAQCPDKQPVHTDLIKLRFAESARAMLVESNAIKPRGLIYCGE